MRIKTLAAAVIVLSATTLSMANAADTSTPLAGATNVAPLGQLNMDGNKDINNFVPVGNYWRCPQRRGQRVTHMTFRRGRAPLCHYKRVYFGWRPTAAAWRHCRRKYGPRVIRALESRTQYRCIYREYRA
jgi:hypothetical protein